MIRLIKLAAYALLGYVMYELVLGISEGEPNRQEGARGQGRGASAEGNDRPRSGRGDGRGRSGSGQTLSGAGGGQQVAVSDSTGAERTERVGRGVVSG